MATRDYSGFQAIVNSVERLRETVNQEADKQLVVTRTIRDYQRSSLVALEQLVENVRTSTAAATRHNLALPDRLQIKNLQLQAWSVTLSARSVIVETKGQLTGNQKAKQDNEQLAKALGSEIKKIKISGGGLGNPLQLIGLGLFTGIGFKFGGEFAKGFEKSIKKNIGLSFRSFGENIGTGVTDPKQAVKDTIKARRSWQVQKEALDQAIKQAEKETVKIDPNKENVFAIGGLFQKGGEGGSYVARQVREARGRKNVNTIPVKNSYSDPETSQPDPKKPIENAVKFLQGIGRDLESNLIKGYNEDAVNLAAKIIAAKKQNPEAKITIEGYSYGGYLVEEALEILKNAGITDVTGRGIGTPDLGVGFDNQNYKSYLGKTDKIAQDFFAQFFMPPEHKRSRSQRLDNIGTMVNLSNHDLDEYLKHPEVIKDLQGEAKSVSSQKISKEFEKELNNKKQIIASIGTLPTGLSEQSINALKKEIENIIAVVETMDLENIDPVLTKYKQLIQALDKESEINTKVSEGQKGIEKLKLPDAPVENLAFSLSHRYRILSKVSEEDLLTPLNLASDIDQQSLYEWMEQAKAEAKNNAVILEKTTKKKLSLEEEEELSKRQFDAIAFANLHQGSMVQVLNNKKAKDSQSNSTPSEASQETKEPIKLIDRYLLYIDNLIEQAKKEAENRIKALIPNYKNLTIEEKKTSVASFSAEVSKEIKEFRKAVVDKESATVVEVGERILGLIQPIRAAYQDLLDTLPPDASGIPSIQAQLRKLTAIQNEVLRGQPKRGSKVGLAQIVGNETATGFVEGIEARIKQVQASGKEIGEAAIEAAKNRLGIASPSKEFENLGKSSGQGYEIGAKKSLNKAAKAIDQEIQEFIKNVENRLNMVESMKDLGLNVGDAVETYFLGLTPFDNSDKILEVIQLQSQKLGRDAKKRKLTNYDDSIKAIQQRLKTLHSNINKFEQLVALNEVYIRAWEKVSRGIPQAEMPLIDSTPLNQGKAAYYPFQNQVRFNDSVLNYKNNSANVNFQLDALSSILHELRHSVQKYLDNLYTQFDVLAFNLPVKRQQNIFKGAKLSNRHNPSPKTFAEEIDAYFYADKNVRGFANKLRNEFAKSGKAITEGLQEGIKTNQDTVIDVVAELVDSTVKTAKNDLGIKSPSKVFEEIGKQSAEGYSQGLEDGEAEVKSALESFWDNLEEIPILGWFVKAGRAIARFVSGLFNQSDVKNKATTPTSKQAVPVVPGLEKYDPTAQEQKSEKSYTFADTARVFDSIKGQKGQWLRFPASINSSIVLAEGEEERKKVYLEVLEFLNELDASIEELQANGADQQLLEILQDRREALEKAVEKAENTMIQVARDIERMKTREGFFDVMTEALDFFEDQNDPHIKVDWNKSERAKEDARIKTLQERYTVYLDKLIQSIQKEALHNVNKLINNYQNLSKRDKLSARDNLLQEVEREITSFREAVENGDTELATELGEKLITKTETLKAVYDDLLTEIPKNSKTGKKLNNQKTYVNSLQQEVIKGSVSKGRAKTGLYQLMGNQVSEGFAEGIEGKLKKAEIAADKLAYRAIWSAKGRLGIASPSKEFEEIGKQSAEGYSQGLEDGQTEVKSALDSFWDSLENIPILGWFVKAGRAIARFVADLFNPKQQSRKQNEPNQVPVEPDSPNRSDQRPNQSGDRPADSGAVGSVPLPVNSPDDGSPQAVLFGRQRDYFLGRRLSGTAGAIVPSARQNFNDAKKVAAQLELAPGFWVDTEKLNDRKLIRKVQTKIIVFWERLRRNLNKEVARTLTGILGTIPGTVIGRGLTGSATGGYLGGLTGRLIAETGFDDVANFRSLQKQGLSPATAEFWQQFGNNRQFLPNKLRKAGVGYVTGSVIGKGIGDVMQVSGASKLLSTLLPSWLETGIGDAINRTIKTIADPNVDLAIPKLPPAANKFLSAPLHALGNSVAAQGFLGNLGLSFLEGQTRTSLMPIREALTGAGKAVGGQSVWGEYLGDRFSSLGIGTIQQTAKVSGRGVAGLIAPGMPGQIRDFIADQVINNAILDGVVRDQAAPYLASRAAGDVFARGVKVPLTGKVSGAVNKTLDKIDPFPIAPKVAITDEQILAEREQRLIVRRQKTVNVVENLYQRLDKSIDSTTKTVVGVSNDFLGFFNNIRIKTHDFARKTAGLTDDPVDLIDQYIVYLDKLIEQAQKEAQEKIKTLVPNYKDFTIPERQEFAANFKTEINKEIIKFRMAIEDGESEIAVEIGERILAMIQPVRAIYQDLLENLPLNVGDTNSIRGHLGSLTNMQNEVLRGQPNQKGRAKAGLTQVVGTETAEGFVQGLNSRIKKVRLSSEELADTAIEAAKKRLGIQSPSKVFEKIGTFLVEGFQKGIDGFKNLSTDSINKFTKKTDEQIANTVNNVTQGFDDLIAKIYEKFPIIKELQDLILGFAASFVLGNLLENLVGQITQLANASFTAVLELESMRVALNSVSGSAEAGAKGLRFVSDEAKRLGIDLRTAEEAYAGLKAATQFSPIRGLQTDRVFSVFAETAALRGLTSEQQGNMFRALSQMANKPLSAEEVKGQLGEIPALAFESTLARSLGINTAQLADMMKGGELQGVDVLPKVAAQYAAENAVIAASSETTAQALTRFQNAIINFQRSFEGWVAGSKVFFNLFAAGLEKLSEIIPIVVKYLTAFGLALFIDIAQATITIAKLKTVQTVLINLTKALQSLFLYALPAIKTFIGQFILVTLAIDAVTNAISIASNAFPELQKNTEAATIRANNLAAAFENVNKAVKNTPKNLPFSEESVATSKTWNLFGFDTGFNLEGTRQFFGLRTLGQKELADFQVNVGDRLAQIDNTLSRQFDSQKVLEDIKAIDKQLTTLRSRRFQIPAGDREAYNESIEAEQKLLEKRDELLKVTATFQQNLQADKADVEAMLKALDELVAKKGITADAEKSIRTQLEERLKAVEQTSTAFEDLVSTLARSVNALSLALRNLNENAAFFNENLERSATNARVQFMRRARAARLGSQVRDLGLEEIDRNTLESRLTFLRDQLGAVNNYLSKPDFADLLAELRQQAEDAGTNLDNTVTIDRLINENRSQQETAVLNALKEQLRLKDEIGQTEENLERSISSARSAITDLNRSVEDFFFNLTQQIEEALVEVDRILNKLKYTDIKNKLARALVPGSDTFVNGLIGQIQGIFDRATGIVEQLLGQRSARINFGGERRGLQVELENFTRNLGGATEALELFRQSLLGNSGQGSSGLPSGSLLPVPEPPRAGKGQLPPPPPSSSWTNRSWGEPPKPRSSANLNIGSNPFNPLFELLFKGEGNENSVNRGRAGDTPNGLRSLFGKDAAQFTVGEIMRLQQQRRIFAVGMPQFIPSTLRGAVESSGISLDTPFNLQTQQRLAIELLKNKRPEIWRYLTGKSDNLIEAAQGMAREWAAIGLSYPEAGRGVGVSRYAGTAGNAASISPAQVQRALQETRRNLGGKTPNTQPPTSNLPNVNAERSRGVDNSRAQALTDRLIQVRERQINLNDASVRQEIEAFMIELRQTQETILRQMGDSIRTSRQSVIDAQNSLLDARSQFSPQTQSAQLENELRGVENQFRGLDTQLFEQERGLQDNIQGLNNLLEQMSPVLEILRASNNQVDRESAKFLEGLIGRIEQDKATYSGMLTEIQSLRGELKQGKIDAENFVQAQAKLRTIQADLERIGTELAIAQQQNNLEQERAIALLQSQQQLQLEQLQIANDFADNQEEQERRLRLAQEQATLREREIEYQFQSKKLSQEIDLINQRLTIAQNLSNLGKRNELELLQSQKQLEQEILEIKKQYPDLAQQELRIQLAKEQALQRELGIENSYRNDRLQRVQELLDLDNQIAEAQAEQLEAGGDVFGAAALREQAAFAAELLRYEQEVEAIRQRYPDDPQRADELIRKATILQGLNLERIDRQFKDLGETIRDVGIGAFSTFLEDTLAGTKSIGDAFLDMTKSILQSLAQIAARMAISGLFRWMNIPGFADGATVPNFAEGDTVKSEKFADLPIKGIQSALRKEGPRGVLAVFTPGEEILSLRTGEAQRYQSLKARFGKNPLAKIGHFADGGTISENLLAGLNNSAIPSGQLPVNFGQTVNQNYRQGDRSVTVNVTAPNPSAFNASERQIGRVVAEYLSRA